MLTVARLDRLPRLDEPAQPAPRRVAGVVWLALFALGCPGPSAPPADSAQTAPLAGVKLRVMVVGDEGLAEAATRLEGEWNAQTEAAYEIVRVGESEAAAVEPGAADVILCPAHLLGELAARGRLAPMPGPLLEEHSRAWRDFFPLLRDRETAWGERVMAVPLGSPVLVLYLRADLLERLKRRPPETWEEYVELARRMSDRASLGDAAAAESQPWHATAEPLGPGWAGLTLLARAAPYARHRNNYSTWFDIETMEPLVAGPPVVRALEELVAAAKLGPADAIEYDPADARLAFWEGRCGMAISWPSAADDRLAGLRPEFPVTLAELPGAREAFDVGRLAWDGRGPSESPRVPLLSVAGRLGVVGAESPRPEAAFRLLLWFSGEQASVQLCPRSPATTLFRQSQAATPGPWVEPPVSPEAARQYAVALTDALGREQWAFALRIPGRAEYLAALDEAVHQAVGNRAAPIEALVQAAAKWRDVTARLGLERQRAAYRASLGLDH